MIFGLRVVRALAIGLPLGWLATGLFWPASVPRVADNPQSVIIGVCVLAAGAAIYVLMAYGSVFFALSYGYGTAVRTLRASPTLAKMAVPLIALLMASLIGLVIWLMRTHCVRRADYSISPSIAGAVIRGLWIAFLILGPLLIALGPAAYIYAHEMLHESPWFRRWFVQTKGKGQIFGGPATAYPLADVPDPIGGFKEGGPGLTHHGVFLGRTIFADHGVPMNVFDSTDAHLWTIGQPGSGKSTTSIWPNLALYAGSTVAIDPKGEHAKKFFNRRHRQGSNASGTRYHLEGEAFALDPFGISGHPSAIYNLLSEIDIKHPNARKLISAISSACVTPSRGENRFWEEMARAMIDGTIAHTKSRYPEQNHNMPFVADLLTGIDPATGFADPQQFRKLVAEMRTNDAAGGLPKLAAAALDDLGDRAYGSVLAELRVALKWATDPAMRKHLVGKSNFTFKSVGERRTTVFICIPFGQMVEQMRWLRSLMQVSMRSLEDRSDAAKNSTAGRVLYILDELPQYGAHLNAIQEGMVTLRSAGIRLWCFTQNVQQLVSCFGHEGAANFQCGSTIQVYGVNDTMTASWVSSRMGEKRVRDTTGGPFTQTVVGERDIQLASPATVITELRKAAPIQYVFTSRGHVLRLERVAFKPLTIDGRRFRGLPLEGHYDE